MTPLACSTARCAASRRAFLLTVCATAAATLSLAACATGTFPFIPDHYTFSRQQVQQAVARKFPFRRSVSQVFDVALTDPAVTLLPQQNRVAVRVDAHLASPLLRAPVDGTLTLSSALVWDDASHSVVLDRPAVDTVDVTGGAAAYAQQIDQVAAIAAAQLLDRYPVYTFKPEQLQFAGVNYAPGAITVLKDGIRVQIVEK